MENQIKIEQQRTAEVSATAVDVIYQIASNPHRQRVLTSGCEAHGVAFAAFLLLPDTRHLDPDNLLDRFYASYCVKGHSRKEATAQLLEHSGWERALRALYDEIEADGVLRWDDRRLREFLEHRYAYIETFEGCYIFDLHALKVKVEE